MADPEAQRPYHPQPHKRLRSSFIRFEAKLPNETWQLDSTPWQLADASPVEILNFPRRQIQGRSSVKLAFLRSRPTTSSGSSIQLRIRLGFPPPSSATMPPSSPASHGGAKSCSSSSWSAWASSSSTRRHITPRPVARSSASTKLSNAFSANSLEPIPWLTFSFSSTPFASSTTAAGHTELSIDRYHSPSSTHSSKPTHPATRGYRPPRPPRQDRRLRQSNPSLPGQTATHSGRNSHKNRKVRLLVAGPDVRILTDDGELIRALTLDPARIYQPLGERWPAHNVLTQARTMS